MQPGRYTDERMVDSLRIGVIFDSGQPCHGFGQCAYANTTQGAEVGEMESKSDVISRRRIWMDQRTEDRGSARAELAFFE